MKSRLVSRPSAWLMVSQPRQASRGTIGLKNLSSTQQKQPADKWAVKWLLSALSIEPKQESQARVTGAALSR
jgi:hypothetical protein